MVRMKTYALSWRYKYYIHIWYGVDENTRRHLWIYMCDDSHHDFDCISTACITCNKRYKAKHSVYMTMKAENNGRVQSSVLTRTAEKSTAAKDSVNCSVNVQCIMECICDGWLFWHVDSLEITCKAERIFHYDNCNRSLMQVSRILRLYEFPNLLSFIENLSSAISCRARRMQSTEVFLMENEKREREAIWQKVQKIVQIK